MIRIDKSYYRPLEIDYLKGDSKKAFKKLNFKPKYNLDGLIKDMITNDLLLAEKEYKLK